MQQTFTVLLDCNDHRNGNFTGQFEMLELMPSHGWEGLICVEGPPTRCACYHGKLHVGRSRVEYLARSTWAGNWCWDSWTLGLRQTLAVLAYLHKRGFRVDSGTGSLFDAWKQRPLVATDLLG